MDYWMDNWVENGVENWADNRMMADVNEKKLCLLKRKKKDAIGKKMRMAKRCEGQKDVKGKKMGRTKRCEWQKVASFITRQNEKKGVCHPIHKSEKSDRT